MRGGEEIRGHFYCLLVCVCVGFFWLLIAWWAAALQPRADGMDCTERSAGVGHD